MQRSKTPGRRQDFSLVHYVPRSYFIFQALDPTTIAWLLFSLTGAPARDLCHIWKEAEAESEGVHNEVQKFDFRGKTEAFLVQGESAGDTPLIQPDAMSSRMARLPCLRA